MIMAARSATLIAAGESQSQALTGGISLAFLVAAVIAVPAAVCAAFLRNPVRAQNSEVIPADVP